MLSVVVAAIEHFNMFGGFLAEAGKTKLELLSVSTVEMANQKKKKKNCNCFQAALVTIKQPDTNAEPIGDQRLGKNIYSVL